MESQTNASPQPVSTAHSQEKLQEELRSFSRRLEITTGRIRRISHSISKMQPSFPSNDAGPAASGTSGLSYWREKKLQDLYDDLSGAQQEWTQLNQVLGVCRAKLQAIHDWLQLAQSPEYHAALSRANGVVFYTAGSFSVQAGSSANMAVSPSSMASAPASMASAPVGTAPAPAATSTTPASMFTAPAAMSTTLASAVTDPANDPANIHRWAQWRTQPQPSDPRSYIRQVSAPARYEVAKSAYKRVRRQTMPYTNT